jgi:hypothetical protein
MNPAKDDATDAAVGYKYVNAKNGMRDRILTTLSDILANDFHEYNARPYARLTAKALENLYDFSDDLEVRRSAGIVLDFLSAKFAVSSNSARRSVPFRRLIDAENDTALFGLDDSPSGAKNDEELPRFLQLSGELRVLQNERRGALSDRNAGPMVVTSTSTYSVPPLIQDLMEGSTTPYFDRYHHEGYELYVGHPLYLLSAGGVYRDGWDPSRWLLTPLDVATSLIGDPVLGPLLTETVIRGLVNGFVEKEQASAVATTLMPTNGGVDRNDLIRIEGSVDRKKRNNTCITHGFACGLNPKMPESIPAGCIESPPDDSNWQFVNLDSTAAPCLVNLGLYVAFWSSPCPDWDDECRQAAGGDHPSFGFFEVFDGPSQGISFRQFMDRVVAVNRGKSRGWRGRNSYITYAGSEILFEPGSPIDSWGILGGGDRDMTAWRPAQGDVINNLYPESPSGQWRRSCVEVDNWNRHRKLILDLSDPQHPISCEVDLVPNRMYGCDHQRCVDANP